MHSHSIGLRYERLTIQQAVKQGRWEYLNELFRTNGYMLSYPLDDVKAVVANKHVPLLTRQIAFLNLIVTADFDSIQQLADKIKLHFYDPAPLPPGVDMYGLSNDSLLGGFHIAFPKGRHQYFYCSALTLALQHNRLGVFIWLYYELKNTLEGRRAISIWSLDCWAAAILSNNEDIIKLLSKLVKEAENERFGSTLTEEDSRSGYYHSCNSMYFHDGIHFPSVLKLQGPLVKAIENSILKNPIALNVLVQQGYLGNIEYWELMSVITTSIPFKIMLPVNNKTLFGDFSCNEIPEILLSRDSLFYRPEYYRYLELTLDTLFDHFQREDFSNLQQLCDNIANVINKTNKESNEAWKNTLFTQLAKRLVKLVKFYLQQGNLPHVFFQLIKLMNNLKPDLGQMALAEGYLKIKNDYVAAYNIYLMISQDRKCDQAMFEQANAEIAEMIYLGKIVLNPNGTLNKLSSLLPGLNNKQMNAQEAKENCGIKAYQYIYKNNSPQAVKILAEIEALFCGVSAANTKSAAKAGWRLDIANRFYTYYMVQNPSMLACEGFKNAFNSLLAIANVKSVSSVSFFNSTADTRTAHKRVASESGSGDEGARKKKSPRKE